MLKAGKSTGGIILYNFNCIFLIKYGGREWGDNSDNRPGKSRVFGIEISNEKLYLFFEVHLKCYELSSCVSIEYHKNPNLTKSVAEVVARILLYF